MGKPVLSEVQRRLVDLARANDVHFLDAKGNKWPLTVHAIERLIERGDVVNATGAANVFREAAKDFLEASKVELPTIRNMKGQAVDPVYGKKFEFRLGPATIVTIINRK